MQGVYVLAVFAGFAFLMYRRTMPALLAVPLMAVIMAAVAGVPAHGIPATATQPLQVGLGDIVVQGSFKLASVFVAVIFGAMLGRVTIDTGIARSIVNFAAEFAGDRPAVVAMILSLIVAVLFVSMSGLGAIIMVGSIVLPIMMTTGVPRKVAATLFLMAFALGFIFNIVNWQFYTKFFGVTQGQLLGYALVLAAIDLVAMVIYAIVSFRTTRDYATWAVKDEVAEGPHVPWYALITPVLPIILYFSVFHVDAIVAFALSAGYGVLTTRPKTAIQTLVAGAIRGIEDVAPAILLFIGIGMLLVAASAPQFSAALQPLVAQPALRNPLVFVIIFGLLSPLALYRGPLNPFGVGIAIFTVLLTAHVFPPIILVAAIMAVVQVQNVCDPTNTQNVWVANFTGVHSDEITKRTLPYQVAVATAACIVVVTGGTKLFATTATFTPLVAPAAAAQVLPGLFAPGRAAMHIAVGTDGSADAHAAATAMVSVLNGWPNVRSFSSEDNPNAADCKDKSYAAFVRVSSSRFSIIEGIDEDIGLELSDCAGWGVDEWHNHQIFPRGPSDQDIRTLGEAAAARMKDWTDRNPAVAANLLAKGLAYDPAHPRPTYFYSLYKTLDGNMRVYVRPGGPAFEAGMRSGDVVDKLDGRFWWEYGTYQTQLRAYDGKPHNFDVTRGGMSYHVQLGDVFE